MVVRPGETHVQDFCFSAIVSGLVSSILSATNVKYHPTTRVRLFLPVLLSHFYDLRDWVRM